MIPRAVASATRAPGGSAHTAYDMPSAAVMCGGGLGAYDIVRMLGRAGIESAVFASHAGDAAFRSRHARMRLLLPEFRERNFPEILERITAVSPGGTGRPVLFYAGDSELMFVSRFRDQLEPSYRFVVPPRAVAEAVMSKVQFIQLASKAGLPAPTARAFSDVSELESAIDTIEMPCIAKPAYNRDWFWETPELRSRFGEYKEALRRFDSRPALVEFCAGLPRRAAGFVVQSYIDGPDERIVSFHGYLDEWSRCLGSFLTREIRTNPPHAGDIAYCETVHDEELTRRSAEYLARVGFRGIVKIDYKWDDRARAYRMLEIEAHYQPWHLLGAYAGINLALIAYRHQRHEPIPEAAGYQDRVRLLHFSQDLKAYWRGYRRTKEWSWHDYVKSLSGTKVYRLYDPDDPLPFVHASLRSLRRHLSRFLSIA